MSRPNHQWDLGAVKHMKIEEEHDVPTSRGATVVDAFETEKLVEKLRKFALLEVGTSQWMDQHRQLEKLNLQAHQNTLSNSDEYVMEAFLTFSKLETLIHDLILIEIWKESVYPLLVEELAGKNSMRLYFILYHEATVVNLLELFFYHKHVCEVGGEKMLEVVDFVASKIARLNNTTYKFGDQNGVGPQSGVPLSASTAKEFAESLQSRSPLEELQQQFMDIDFRVCVAAVSIGRFLCEHADALPLSVVGRITDTHDLLVLLIPLIENPPWTRRLDGGPEKGRRWQKLVDFQWTDVEPIDLLKVTKLEGQPWLAVYHLLAKEVFRERYHLNSFRKGQLLRVRKYINELLLDQLPFLADVQRYMDELQVTEVPEPSSLGGGGSVFLFQQVPALREAILRDCGRDLAGVAARQVREVFTMTDRADRDLLAMADLYTDDLGPDGEEHQ